MKSKMFIVLGFLFMTMFLFQKSVNAQTSPLPLQNITTTCIDSDSGIDYYVKGTTTEIGAYGSSSVTDTCTNYDYVNEHYCNGTKINRELLEYLCEYGCSDGACLRSPPVCYDSDPQNDLYVKGYVTIDNGLTKYYDVCATEEGCINGTCLTKLKQLYCDDYKIKYKIYECSNGCSNGACIQQNISCIGEGESLGPVIPNNTNFCCPGLKQIPAISPANCQPLLGTRGYCTKCGDGICKSPENLCNCPEDCQTKICPEIIDLSFNKKVYYPGDYLEMTVKIYDKNGNLIPNHPFNLYNFNTNTSATYYTDSNGVYKMTSFISSNITTNEIVTIGSELTFLASITKEGCNYISDRETIYINISKKCGDGYCEENEKELVCLTICELTDPDPSCKKGKYFCHVKCPIDCTPNCGNGVCDTIICQGLGCPIPENEYNCPQDCESRKNYCGDKSSDPSCICPEEYKKEIFEAPCEWESTKVCTYYRCMPQPKISLLISLYTDKMVYDINEIVNIQGDIEIVNIEGDTIEIVNIQGYLKGRNSSQLPKTLAVYVKKPSGITEPVMLNLKCEIKTKCPLCEPGGYCLPCENEEWCKYTGTFTKTNEIGEYTIYGKNENFTTTATSFRVYDKSILKKYLITEDIDGFRYKYADLLSSILLSPIPPHTYFAVYEKTGKEYAVIVTEVESREEMQKQLNMVLEKFSYTEEKFDGYYIYVLDNFYGSKAYVWSYRNFLVLIFSQPSEVVTPIGGVGAIKMEPRQSSPLTGMITGMPFAGPTTEEDKEVSKHCGSDSLYSECICSGDEVKESFIPPCTPGSMCDNITHYRCVPKEPKELIRAYLDKYPSDIRAIGAECEQEGGYCIYFEDSCKSGFEETNLECGTKSEKCCVKKAKKEDFIEIVFKLEDIRVKMDKFQRNANALADYYKLVGDEERARKFINVANMFARAKEMVDKIIAIIRENIENPEAIKDEVKSQINELRQYINSILDVMVS